VEPPDRPRTAFVVGGGIAGLAVAGLLHRAGWQVQVRERSTELPATGTALGMWPAAMQALARTGIADRIRGAGVHRSDAVIRRDLVVGLASHLGGGCTAHSSPAQHR